ncbi:MAG: CYTH domain-containing protein [Gammaproteobacteria bacterium]|nr:CYTH domain-containing protein [Gammaproteobacteria bacterium]
MATEIERKFLLLDESWKEGADEGTLFRQGYLIGGDRSSVRVRIEGDTANLNIKSATLGIRRSEFEYPIPLDEANTLLDELCEKPIIEKHRYHLHYQEHLWEIDVFHGDNEGLIVAEIELEDEHENFSRPPWLGQEVSDDPRYYNVCLVKQPYCTWPENQ